MATVGFLAQVSVLVGGAALVVVLWLLFGRAPRCRRLYGRAQRLLQAGQWQQALTEIAQQPAFAAGSPAWQQRFRKLEADCHAFAGEEALAQKDYEASLDHHLRAAQVFDLDAEPVRQRLREAMLTELYRRFADGSDVQTLGNRLLKLFPACTEALFWQALDDVRRSQLPAALGRLRSAADCLEPAVEPPLYLGALLLRQGEPAEALHYLRIAQRIAPNCPLVHWQLGAAQATAGDSAQAVQLLQRAAGSDGLPRWLNQPTQLWTAGLADTGHSYIARLAATIPYRCPVFGHDVIRMLHEVRLALAQAYERLKQFAEAADVYAGLLRDYPPTISVLRGLGLSLARLGRYDEAFTHLRTAHAQDQTRDPLTPSYLALCAARGKPLRPEDRANNLRWALGLLRQFKIQDNEEWAAVYATVATDARTAGVALPVGDVQRLCAALVSVSATSPDAAFAYADLAGVAPELLQAEHACLYGWAATSHQLITSAELSLFAALFQDEAGAADFYVARGWDLDDVRAYCLKRHAAMHAGSFPQGLAHGEDFLLQRSEQQEKAGEQDAALQTATLLLRLTPRSARVLDRLAYLYHRRGALEKCVGLLAEWETLEPTNPTPAVRRAIVERQFGRAGESAAAIDRALALTRGRARVQVALLGGRLALSARGDSTLPLPTFELSTQPADLERAERLFEQCVSDGSAEPEALWCLAAVRSLRRRETELAHQARVMLQPDVPEPRFHYLAAVCQLATGAPAAAIEAAGRTTADPFLKHEGAYLSARARLALGDQAGAVRELNEILAEAPNTPAADYARALLGRLHFAAGAWEDAIRSWIALPAERRAAWQLDEPLRQTSLLAGVQALRAGLSEQAISHLQEAAERGVSCRELVNLARYQAAGQGPPERAAELLEQMIADGEVGPHVLYRLAMIRKRLGHWSAAASTLEALPTDQASIHVQLGLLALRENRLTSAEQEFAQAWAADPVCFEAGYNLLLTRLSLGPTDQVAELALAVAKQASEPIQQRLLEQIHALLRLARPANGEAHPDAALTSMTAIEEQRLWQLVQSIGHLDSADRLLRALHAVRPDSEAVRETAFGALLARAGELVRRCRWAEARRLLGPHTADAVARPLLAAGLNLLGICECLMQDFADGLQSFALALRLVESDPYLHQNLALACEWQAHLAEAGKHWERYFELLGDRLPIPPGEPDYVTRLSCEGLSRLAGRHAEGQDWAEARDCLERALRACPEGVQVLERLFELHHGARRWTEAREILDRLRQLRPDDPQYEVYTLDLIDLSTPDEVERVLTDVDRLRQQHAGDQRVESRLMAVIVHAVEGLGELHEEMSNQLTRARTRLRRLPQHEIDWDEVEDFARRLHRRLLKLKVIVDRSVPLTLGDEQQHLRELSQQLTREAAQCRRLVH